MPTPSMSLNVVSPDSEMIYFGRAECNGHTYYAASLVELHDILKRQLGKVRSPTTLDLMGHSTRGHHLLRLGDTPIDMLDPRVARFFRALAETRMLSRLEIVAVRLLGCETAVTDAGQRTIRMLSRTLRLPVFGTLKPLNRNHCNSNGFNPAFAHLLVEATTLTR